MPGQAEVALRLVDRHVQAEVLPALARADQVDLIVERDQDVLDRALDPQLGHRRHLGLDALTIAGGGDLDVQAAAAAGGAEAQPRLPVREGHPDRSVDLHRFFQCLIDIGHVVLISWIDVLWRRRPR